MFIQKTFHVHRSLGETKGCLSRLHLLKSQLAGVEKAVITADGVGQFDCALSHGVRAHCVLVGLPTEDENQVLFQSTTGNLHLSGLVEFQPIRESLTEVQLTLEYGFKSPISAALDRFLKIVERFFQAQLTSLQTQIDGTFGFMRTASEAHAGVPQLAR